MTALSSAKLSPHPSDAPQSETTLLKRENEELRAQVANLQNERAQLLRIASSAVSLLQRPPHVGEQTEMWLLKEDEKVLRSMLQQSEVGREEKGVWRWTKVPEPNAPYSPLPNFTIKNQVESYSGFRPFLHAFPLEVFELILSFADKQTIARTCGASLACLQLFSPKLYHSLQIGGLALIELFDGRAPRSSARLASSLSLNNIRILEVASSSLHSSALQDYPFDSSNRLDRRIELDRFTITLDTDPWVRLDLGEDEEEESDRGSLTLFDVCPALLSLLDPTELVVQDGPEWWTDDPTYRLSDGTAREISAWSRLRTVRLMNIDVVWKEDDEEPLEYPPSGSCFLGLNGTVDIASEDVSLFWDSSTFYGADTENLPPSFWWDNMIDLLVKRDQILSHPSITSATIVVGNEWVRREMQQLIEGYDEEVPDCVQVIVRERS